MSYCQKCGNKISEEMSFCPKCGASLKIEQTYGTTRIRAHRRNEKAEKAEKGEKNEKGEKHEKHEHAFIGPLIGGLILIFLGLAAYVQMTEIYDRKVVWAFFFIMIGTIIIVGAVYGAMMASKRHPKT